VANAVGTCDYDEAVWAVEAVARQWHRVADELDASDPQAIRVRMAAIQLCSELARDDLDLEMLPDLIAICAIDDELRNHAASSAMASEQAEGDSYVMVNADRIQQAFGLLGALKADLRKRGELGLDDELLPPDLGE
jgi:hypothetical protein